MMKELRDLFGSGHDVAINELAVQMADIEKRWKEMQERLSSIVMPTSYKNAVESIEYGFVSEDIMYEPVPFLRVAGMKYKRKWNNMVEEIAAEFVGMEIGAIDARIARTEDEIRKDIFDTALEHGVPRDVADVFKMKFKKNYRNVQMCEWVHGNSENPRDYHARKWDGHTGKINGKPNGLDGYVFPLDKPPVIDWDKNGIEIRGFPGDLPNCSCLLVPVFE